MNGNTHPFDILGLVLELILQCVGLWGLSVVGLAGLLGLRLDLFNIEAGGDVFLSSLALPLSVLGPLLYVTVSITFALLDCILTSLVSTDISHIFDELELCLISFIFDLLEVCLISFFVIVRDSRWLFSRVVTLSDSMVVELSAVLISFEGFPTKNITSYVDSNCTAAAWSSGSAITNYVYLQLIPLQWKVMTFLCERLS